MRENKEVMTSYEFNSYLKSRDKKRNKYNAVKQTYKGVVYDSKREAQYAAELDLRIKAKEVKKWERQHKISIDVNGIHIANYLIDFKVWLSNGRVEYHEVKGAETMLWRLKWKLTKAIYPDYNLVLIK